MSAPASIAPPLVRTQHIGDESAINLGTMVLVASKTSPGTWYQVQDGHCSCKGFQFRTTCRHLAVAELASPKPAPSCARCHQPRTLMHATGVCAICLSTQPAD